MSRYVVPVLLTAILIAVLVGINRGIWWAADFFSTEVLIGFLAGCAFCVGLYYIIIWIDPASRPRGSGPATDHERPRNRLD